jgi:hypothetical protein
MPSTQASRRTALHRRQLDVIARLVGRQVRSVAAAARVDDIDTWWDRNNGRLTAIVLRGFSLSATLSGRYMRHHAAIEGRTVHPILAEIDRDQIETSLRVTGPVAFKTHMRVDGNEAMSLHTMEQTLAGSAERLTLLGDRKTVEDTVAASDVLVGYRRQTRAGACGFCLMLASRGAVYKDRRSSITVVGANGRTRGSREIGESYHDNCRCSAEPLYEHEDEPASVLALQDRWHEVAAGKSPKAALAALRKAAEAPQSA